MADKKVSVIDSDYKENAPSESGVIDVEDNKMLSYVLDRRAKMDS
jgi:hypothetical protein